MCLTAVVHDGEGVLKFYDLFAGIGGFHRGLEMAGGYECVGACERDRHAAAVYAAHWPDVEIDFDANGLDRLPRSTELLCAGFPCQPFSLAGRKLGFEDSRGGLFAEIIRLAADRRVPYILLENVTGLLSNDSNLTFATILRSLDACGYDVQWLCINGLGTVPQTRDRVFVAAHLRGKRAPEILSLAEGDRWDTEARQEARKVQSAAALTTRASVDSAVNQNIVMEDMIPNNIHLPDDYARTLVASYGDKYPGHSSYIGVDAGQPAKLPQSKFTKDGHFTALTSSCRGAGDDRSVLLVPRDGGAGSEGMHGTPPPLRS